MSVTVGDRIQSLLDHMGKGEIELGLSDVFIAIDITAQKHYRKDKSSSVDYNRFLAENMWIILMTGLGSLISSSIKLPFKHKDIRSDETGYCTLEQIIYHIFRCGFIHGTGEQSKIKWTPQIPLAIDAEGDLNISPAFIWGLALVVITCEVNKEEKVDELCWVSTASFKYLINDLWGKRNTLINISKSNYGLAIDVK